MNPKYQRLADRLCQLIEEGQAVAKLERPSSVGLSIQGEDNVKLQAWLVKTSNILETVFGLQSPHMRHFSDFTRNGAGSISYSSQVSSIVGVLQGALNDLEDGFLLGQEFLIAAEIFDSVLDQAKYLNQNGYKDPAAVLARVVLEDALKRLANEKGLDNTKRASKINDELRGVGAYGQPQWRLVQAWLDIGNAAAHGNFAEYKQEDIGRLIEDIGRFLATDFRK